MNGEKFPQSIAIARHLARQFKLAGEDELEATKCDIIVDTMQEINEAYFRAWFSIEDEAQKQEAQKVFKAETMPKTLQGLENLYASYGNGTWAVGNNVTWADLIVFASIHNLLVLDSEVLDKCSDTEEESRSRGRNYHA